MAKKITKPYIHGELLELLKQFHQDGYIYIYIYILVKTETNSVFFREYFQ